MRPAFDRGMAMRAFKSDFLPCAPLSSVLIVLFIIHRRRAWPLFHINTTLAESEIPFDMVSFKLGPKVASVCQVLYELVQTLQSRLDSVLLILQDLALV